MIETGRLILRSWREEDTDPFHAMSNDAEVMEFLGDFQTREQVAAAMARQNDLIRILGYAFWALERREDGAFLGFCGIKPAPLDIPVAGEMEIGWRLARPYWGQGYAREAAQACLDWAWSRGMRSVIAVTNTGNARSYGLMERLGMRRVPEDDFDHPLAPDRLKPTITYRIARPRA